jgi:hypothetical protein
MNADQPLPPNDPATQDASPCDGYPPVIVGSKNQTGSKPSTISYQTPPSPGQRHNEEISLTEQWLRVLKVANPVLSALTIVCFGFPVIGEHGLMSFVWIWLLIGWRELPLPVTLGWVGIALLFGECFVPRRWSFAFSIVGLASCLWAYCLFYQMSISPGLTPATAIPFFATALFKLLSSIVASSLPSAKTSTVT